MRAINKDFHDLRKPLLDPAVWVYCCWLLKAVILNRIAIPASEERYKDHRSSQ